LPLLKALNGYGPNSTSFNKYWQGGGLGYKGVHYNIGPSPKNVTLNLVNTQDYTITPIWNVIGIINGTIPDEVVVVGNHRDAWIAGGAGDPHSGTTVINEVIRSLGKATALGWKPLRTIVFASWDGEEYGLVGSTEWVEEYFPWLSASAVAYLNVDVGARGTAFDVAASPLLNSLVFNSTSAVESPDHKHKSIRDTWNGRVRTMGSGSDFTAFQDFVGVPSMDLGFSRAPQDAVYHYHSNFDSFHWMDRYGDPGWLHQVAIAKLLGLATITLAERPILPLNATDYATGLEAYLETVKEKAKQTKLTGSFNFARLERAALKLRHSAIKFDAYTSLLSDQIGDNVPWWKWWKKVKLYFQVRAANAKYKLLERQFLHSDGLDNRPWFKHVVFAPGRWTGYAGATFPGLIESFEDGNMTNARKWAAIIESKLDQARKLLD
jgi:N-acetylated-alpha-linked acidic dipeptidase